MKDMYELWLIAAGMSSFLALDFAYYLYEAFAGQKQEQKKEPSELEQECNKNVQEKYQK